MNTAILAYAIGSRLAYVAFIGIALRRQERRMTIAAGQADEAGFRRFRRAAAWLMYNDAAAFIVLCLVTRDTLTLPLGRGAVIATGVALVIVGLGVKWWAVRTLGANAYYWYDFFVPGPAPARPASAGPYRFASSPMYTIGYLQTYGLAAIMGSLPGLVAAAFFQAAILAFYVVVERPHFDRLQRGPGARVARKHRH